jgi:hypothetical protein
MLRAGLKEPLVTGIPHKMIVVSIKPMGKPAKPAGARSSVAPRTVKTSYMVRNISATKQAPMA